MRPPRTRTITYIKIDPIDVHPLSLTTHPYSIVTQFTSNSIGFRNIGYLYSYQIQLKAYVFKTLNFEIANLSPTESRKIEICFISLFPPSITYEAPWIALRLFAQHEGAAIRWREPRTAHLPYPTLLPPLPRWPLIHPRSSRSWASVCSKGEGLMTTARKCVCVEIVEGRVLKVCLGERGDDRKGVYCTPIDSL